MNSVALDFEPFVSHAVDLEEVYPFRSEQSRSDLQKDMCRLVVDHFEIGNEL